MKYKKQISKNYRRTISILLLLYFVTSPILFAFPQKTCSGACPMAMNKNNSEMQMNIMNSSHCGMMMMRSQKHHNPCNAEFDMSKCNMDDKYTSAPNYIITVKYPVNITLKQISIIDFHLIGNDFSTLEINKTYLQTKDLPIYLVVDSFLI